MPPWLCVINVWSFNLHLVFWSLMNSYYSEHPLNEKCSLPAGSFYHLKVRTWRQPEFLLPNKSRWSINNSFCQNFYPKAGKIHTHTHPHTTHTYCSHTHTVYTHAHCSYTHSVHSHTHWQVSWRDWSSLCILHFICRILSCNSNHVSLENKTQKQNAI